MAETPPRQSVQRYAKTRDEGAYGSDGKAKPAECAKNGEHVLPPALPTPFGHARNMRRPASGASRQKERSGHTAEFRLLPAIVRVADEHG
jgi:hypothetical protein